MKPIMIEIFGKGKGSHQVRFRINDWKMYTSVWEVCLAWVFRPLLQVQIEQLLLKCNFHTHTRAFSIFFTPEVGQSVRFWFLPSSACFRGDGWHDHGCGHGRGRQLGHQDNNSMHRRNWTRVMDDPCKTFWNTLEMFSHFLSWERDKSAWHNPSMGHRTGTSHRTNTSRGTGVIGERGEKYFPMGERLHSSNSQREIELQLSEKANSILPLIKT